MTALGYACRCQWLGDAESAVSAAVQGYEAADYLAQSRENIDFTQPGAEASILKSAYVQDELQRQVRDLKELTILDREGSRRQEIVEQLQARAMSEGSRLRSLAATLG